MKQIIIDCNKESSGYCLRINPKSECKLKPDPYRPRTVSIRFDIAYNPELTTDQWKLLCKGLLNIKKMVPCVVKQVGSKKVYFRWPLNFLTKFTH